MSYATRNPPAELDSCVGREQELIDLLTDTEQTVLRRLAPFVGGFGLDAARAVCSGGDVAPEDVLDHLTRLVDKSLVAVEVRTQRARFHLLETVRQYAAAWMQAADEEAATGAQHLRWFLDLAERAEPEQRSADQTLWLDRLELEHDNITAALEWSRSAPGGAEAGLRLAAALRWFWFARGHPSEGRQWLERGLAETAGIALPVRARGLDAAGALCRSLGDLVPAETYLTEGLAIWRQLGDKRGMATSLNNLAALSIDRGDYATGQPFLRESLGQLTPREHQVASLVSQGLTNRGIADQLGIATATATLHVEHIRGKLGFHSRAQIASWVSRSS